MTITQGEVVTIHWVAEDGGPAHAVREIEITADWGLAGDYRSGQGSKRQVTFVSQESLDDVARVLGHAVEPGASRRQIAVRGIELNPLVGKNIRIGPVELQVEDLCHGCDRMNDTIGPGGRKALENRAGITCSVLTGGTIRAGDSVAVSATPE